MIHWPNENLRLLYTTENEHQGQSMLSWIYAHRKKERERKRQVELNVGWSRHVDMWALLLAAAIMYTTCWHRLSTYTVYSLTSKARMIRQIYLATVVYKLRKMLLTTANSSSLLNKRDKRKNRLTNRPRRSGISSPNNLEKTPIGIQSCQQHHQKLINLIKNLIKGHCETTKLERLYLYQKNLQKFLIPCTEESQYTKIFGHVRKFFSFNGC